MVVVMKMPCLNGRTKLSVLSPCWATSAVFEPLGPQCIDLMYSFMSIHQIKGTPLEKLGTGLNFCARQIRSSLKTINFFRKLISYIQTCSTLYSPIQTLETFFDFI